VVSVKAPTAKPETLHISILINWSNNQFQSILYIHVICDERTVVRPSRKNGEVTKRQNHTNSLLSWQKKDPLWRISRKVARFSQQAKNRAMSVDV